MKGLKICGFLFARETHDSQGQRTSKGIGQVWEEKTEISYGAERGFAKPRGNLSQHSILAPKKLREKKQTN